MYQAGWCLVSEARRRRRPDRQPGKQAEDDGNGEHTRQVQLAVEAMLLVGKACVAGISATATRCEESNYYNRQDEIAKKERQGTAGFWFWLAVGDVHDRRDVFSGWTQRIDGETAIGGGCGAAAPEKEQQQQHTKRPIWMVCKTGKWRREGGSGWGWGCAVQEAGARPAGQGRTGQNIPYCRYAVAIGTDQARGFCRSAVTG
jgi:hypothetical protein